ncbi:GTP-binding protein GEM [Toxocara canis]|uniref:GTP-binding protein GEM n=1 Tax=Toxocara canis TaxID=6265 RepID=A0A0B2VKB3_TOXCA|nr:GTP-binding protein GEM [Toxocara canis]
MAASRIRRATLPVLPFSPPQLLSPASVKMNDLSGNSSQWSNSLSENSVSSCSISSDDFSAFVRPFRDERPLSARTYRSKRKLMREMINDGFSSQEGEKYARQKAFRSGRDEQSRKMRHFSISKQGKMIDRGFYQRGDICLVEPECSKRSRRATCPEIWLSPDESGTNIRKCILRVYGDANVGKNAIAQRIVEHAQTSSSDAHFQSTDVEDLSMKNIGFIMNNAEYQMEIVRGSALESEPFHGNLTIYLLVYSIERRESFKRVVETLFRLFENRRDRTGISAMLIANKIDLQRSRRVSTLEGKMLSKIYKCAYVEISAALALNMDILWGELLRMIQKHVLKEEKQCARDARRRGALIEAIRRSGRRVARSCEELVARLAAI